MQNRHRFATKTMSKAKSFELFSNFNKFVYIGICGKIENRRFRHEHFSKMDAYHMQYRMKNVLNNLLSYQKIQRALRFRQLNVYDDFMFQLKSTVNRTRYSKALVSVANQLLCRKMWIAFKRTVKDKARKRRMSEHQVKKLKKPIMHACFIHPDTIRKCSYEMDEWQRDYRIKESITVLFRHFRWRHKCNTRLSDCSEHYLSMKLRCGINALKSNRSKHINSRRTTKILNQRRVNFKMKKVMIKFTIHAMSRWANDQKYRLVSMQRNHLLMQHAVQHMNKSN